MSEKIILDRDKLAAAAERIKLAEHVYAPEDAVPDGWRKVTDSLSTIPLQTGFYAALYERAHLKRGDARYVLAFRGIDNTQNLSSLFSILARRVPAQYDLAMQFVDHIAQKEMIAPQNIEMTGHSLGGYLARTVGESVGAKKIWAFNSPGPTSEIKQKLASHAPVSLPQDAVIHIRSKDDVISKWGYDHGTVIEIDTAGNHHCIADLRRAMMDALENKKTETVAPLPKPEKHFSAMSLFNVVSREVCQSPKVQKFIRDLFL